MTSLATTLWDQAAQRAQDSFCPSDLRSAIPRMSDSQLDALPFGAIRTDDTGRILAYNRRQSELDDVPRHGALGRNYFRDVAPCGNASLLLDKLREGAEQGELDHLLPFTFRSDAEELAVRIHLFHDGPTATNWVLVQRA